MENIEDIEDILFYPWKETKISYFIVYSIGRYRGYRKYPILSFFLQGTIWKIWKIWRIWKISYFIHGEKPKYPILYISPGDSMDDIGRIRGYRRYGRYIFFPFFYMGRYRRYREYGRYRYIFSP